MAQGICCGEQVSGKGATVPSFLSGAYHLSGLCCCCFLFIIILIKGGRSGQIRALGTGTTAVQDGSLLGPETTLSLHTDVGSRLPGAPGWEQGTPRVLGAVSECRRSSEAMRAPGCVAEGVLGLQRESRLEKAGRLDEQLPSLWMASALVAGVERRSGLPPITISLRDSRSIHRSIRCLLDGFPDTAGRCSKSYSPLCLLETQLPAMWCLLSWQLQASLLGNPDDGCSLLWATRELQGASG